MLRRGELLSALEIERLATARASGLHHDGLGLYLKIGQREACSWVFRYMLNREQRELGLGPYPDFTLAEARVRAREYREIVKKEKRHPAKTRNERFQDRKQTELAKRIADARKKTFRQCAEEFIPLHTAGLTNAKAKDQWSSSLEAYAYPVLGDLPVSAIDTPHVMQVLTPIWTTKNETASRVRQRITAILDWAKENGYRDAGAPLLKSLKRPKRRTKHHPALPYAALPKFMAKLRQQDGITARALEFTILTAARTSETIGTTWPEIGGATWTIPAERMKASLEHRVPLSVRAQGVLLSIAADEGYVFPSPGTDDPLSNNAMLALLERMGYGHVTVHGFRSTFRDWAGEETSHPHDICEAALAHARGKVHGAYQRGDLFAKRQQLMEDWAKTCEAKT